MAIGLNTQGATGYDSYNGTNEPVPGKYHVVVQAAEEREWRKDAATVNNSLVMEFQILKGTSPAQEGRVHKEFFAVNEKKFNLDRLARLAMILGLINGNEQRDVNFAMGVGKHLVIQVDDDTYEGKSRKRIPMMNFWPIGDPAVAGVPVDEQALAQPAQVKVAHTAQPQPVGAGVGHKDQWSDL